MNVLITGARGFVGKHLLESLLQKKDIKITTLGRGQTIDHPSVKDIIISDLCDVENWEEILNDIDIVIHLAARVHYAGSLSEEFQNEYERSNVELTEKIAKAALKNNVKKFIFMSSVKVMGEYSQKPFCEEDKPCPTDYYGMSKLKAEEILTSLWKEKDYYIIRPPLIYGPGVKANFLKLLKISESPLPLPFKSFRKKRSFLYIGNLISFIEHIIFLGGEKGVYFVSDGKDLSLSKLLELMRRLKGRKACLFFFPLSIFKLVFYLIGKPDIYQKLNENLQVDISKSKATLNWSPSFSIEEGLEKSFFSR